MMHLLKILLLKIVDEIDNGNTNLTAEECGEVINYLNNITNKTEKLSKYQACLYLNISRATFDNYVKEGKLPKGLKQQGFKELFWVKKDLDKFLEDK